MINRTGIENDIDLRQAQRAYEGVSFRSEKRGEMRDQYLAVLMPMRV